jgi:two-component system response regulator RegA
MNTSAKTLLIVDDDVTFAQVLARAMRKRDFETFVANDIDTALSLARENSPTYAVVDLKLAENSGLQLIEALAKEFPAINIVMLTGYSSIATAVEAVKLGATHYLCKPAGVDEILAAFNLSRGNANIELPDNPLSIDRLEWEHIQKILQDNNGNISATARILGMHRRTLQRKLLKRPVKQ